MARTMFYTLLDKIMTLPDNVQVRKGMFELNEFSVVKKLVPNCELHTWTGNIL